MTATSGARSPVFGQHLLLRPSPPLRSVPRLDALDALRALVAALPDARLVVLEDSAHSAPKEEPETVAKTLREFAAHLGRNE